jgi:DNA-binding protein H-NS
MQKSYAQLLQDIQALEKQAEALRKNELPSVIKSIREAISTYGLTASDLGLNGSTKPQTVVLTGPSLKLTSRAKSPQAGTKVPAKYRDSEGNEWTGRGMKPRWLNVAMATGASLESFLIGTAGAKPTKAGKGASKAAPQSAKPKGKGKKAAKAKANGTAKYKDGAGNTWSGRGPMPGWLKAAVAGGKTLAQLTA